MSQHPIFSNGASRFPRHRSSRTGSTWPWCWTASSCGCSLLPVWLGHAASSARLPHSTTHAPPSISCTLRSEQPPPSILQINKAHRVFVRVCPCMNLLKYTYFFLSYDSSHPRSAFYIYILTCVHVNVRVQTWCGGALTHCYI